MYSFTNSILYSAIFVSSMNVMANVDIATMPLEKAATQDPNVVFILDDSGSMNSAYMPDQIANYNRPSCNFDRSYRLGGQSFRLCTLSGNLYYADSDINKVYFDPAATYNIPRKSDGSLYPDTFFNNASMDGYDPNAAKINLETNYYLFVDFYQPALNGSQNRNIFFGPRNDQAQGSKAFYTKRKKIPRCQPVSSYSDDSCFDYIEVNSESMKKSFAVWFTYYRTREMVSKSSVSEAFDVIPADTRFGYFGLNNRGELTALAKYSDVKANFLNWLGNKTSNGGTPLVEAIQTAGEFFKTKDPWYNRLGDPSSGIVGCRRSFAILMTDGYYSNRASNLGNQDGEDASPIAGASAYKARPPYADNVPDSLADMAMKYWKEDLLPDVPNRLIPTRAVPSNYATWQHMTTYGIALGVDGSVTYENARNAAINGTAVDWWGGSEQENKINDMIHATINTFGKFLKANNPAELKDGMRKIVEDILGENSSSTSLGATTLNSVSTETTVYQASYSPNKWSGDLEAFDAENMAGQQLPSKWKASEKLPSFDKRNIIYRSPSRKTLQAFSWDNIRNESTLLPFFNHVKNEDTQKIINYIRGERTNEYDEKTNPNGILRSRDSVIGDIVHSHPLFLESSVDMNYQRYGWGAGYRAFLDSQSSRQSMIYVGSNSGMLHAFNANTGVEVFAYIPSSALQKAANSTFNPLYLYSQRNYKHMFMVDAPTVVADVQINNAWRKVLFSGSGRGGNNVFALDITDATTPTLLWDIQSAEIGAQIGKAQVIRAENNEWYLAYGSGYNNGLSSPALVLVHIQTGQVKFIDTKAGRAANPGSGTDVAVLDVNNNGNVDTAYMGDSFGNVWKFDLSDSSEHPTNNPTSKWNLAFSGSPLFTATRTVGNSTVRQGISAGLQAMINPADGYVWVFFGTGRYVTLSDPTDTSVQSMYGIKDGTSPISGRNQLQERLLTDVGSYRQLLGTSVIPSNLRGWYFDLSATGERIVDTPQLIGGEMILSTRKPDGDSCQPKGSGYVMMFNPFTGTRLPRYIFDFNNDGVFDAQDGVNGVEVSGFSTDTQNSHMTISKTQKLGTVGVITTNIAPKAIKTNIPLDLGRQSWYEVMR